MDKKEGCIEEVSVEEVKYIAELAKLSFNEGDTIKMKEELEGILGIFKSLDSIDLSSVDMNKDMELNRTLREDKVAYFEDKEKLMQNVKTLRDGAIEVPKIIE